MKRRLVLARALMHRPRLLILDEPTAGVDVELRLELWQYCQRINGEGTTILLTTHYMEEAEILCDRLAIMDHGHILEMGTVNELISKRFKERTVRLDATDQLTDAELTALPAVVSMKRDEVDILLYTADVAATIGSLLVLCEAHGVEPGDLGVRRPTLEDVFLDLTGRALRD
jgi:ABC-2 type transport system ATP-binding protein